MGWVIGGLVLAFLAAAVEDSKWRGDFYDDDN